MLCLLFLKCLHEKGRVERLCDLFLSHLAKSRQIVPEQYHSGGSSAGFWRGKSGSFLHTYRAKFGVLPTCGYLGAKGGAMVLLPWIRACSSAPRTAHL